MTEILCFYVLNINSLFFFILLQRNWKTQGRFLSFSCDYISDCSSNRRALFGMPGGMKVFTLSSTKVGKFLKPYLCI